MSTLRSSGVCGTATMMQMASEAGSAASAVMGWPRWKECTLVLTEARSEESVASERRAQGPSFEEGGMAWAECVGVDFEAGIVDDEVVEDVDGSGVDEADVEEETADVEAEVCDEESRSWGGDVSSFGGSDGFCWPACSNDCLSKAGESVSGAGVLVWLRSPYMASSDSATADCPRREGSHDDRSGRLLRPEAGAKHRRNCSRRKTVVSRATAVNVLRRLRRLGLMLSGTVHFRG